MKSKKPKILKIDYFPLQRVEVIKSTKVYRPGSIGYICWTGYMEYPIYSITQPLHIMFMRFGRKGKPRVIGIDLLYSSMDLSNLTKKENDILVKHGHILRPDNTILQATVQKTKDLRELSGVEFLCYISAFSAYIDRLNNLNINQHHPHINLRNLGTQLDILPDFNEASLHRFITLASTIRKDRGKDPADHPFNQFKQFFQSNENRQICMEKLYKALSTLKTASEQYHQNQIAIGNVVKLRIEKLLRIYGKDNKKSKIAKKTKSKHH